MRALGRRAGPSASWKVTGTPAQAVTITVYMNNFLFYGDVNPAAGEPDYDHIVTVLHVESTVRRRPVCLPPQ